MAQNYTRQSSFADGDTITAALFNNEFNQVVNAFAYSASSDSSTGHKHDGTSGQGGNIPQIGDIDFLNKIVVDNTNNRWGFYVQVSGGTVEQLRIQDGAIVPVTNNDIDLGTSSLEFKDLFLDGTAHIDTLDVDVNATVAGTLGVTGATTLSSTLGVTGAITGSSTLQATTITATTAFVPDASDGASLGTVSLEFSDLFLADGALIAFGNDQDVTITHLADAGLLLNGARGLFFNDTTQYINAPNGTTLDIAATDEIELNATLIDINGAADVSGNLAVGGNLTVTGNATIAGNLTFGDAATDTVAFSADVASNLLPSVDNTYDLGASGSEWKDLYIDGTANIDSLVADTADINGGTIDGATIATSDITVGSGKTLNVSAGTLTLADDQISGDKVEGGTIAATTITTLTSTTVDTTNLEVTTLKAKDGTAAGSIADSTGVVTLASSVLTTTDINGGTVDGVTIGGSSAGDITYANLSDGTITITAFADEDDMVSNSATLVPTQQSVKAYVDAQVTAQDLDIVGDTGTDAIDLDSETITFTGGTGITSVVTTGTVTHNIDSTVATLTGSQTLTNKSLTAPTLTGTAIVASLDISGDIDVDGTTNLDVVDIDGAVDMASTLAVGGNVTMQADDALLFIKESDGTNIAAVGDLTGSGQGGAFYYNHGGTAVIQLKSYEASQINSGIVFNESGADVDFRVESDSNANMLFVDGGNSHVGIGTATLNRSGLGADHIVLTVGADTEMGMLELQGTRTSDADLGRISFLNAGTRRAEIVAARIDADNSTKLYFQTSDAGSLGTRLTIGKDGAATFNSTIAATSATFTTADNLPQLTLVSTDADANAGPLLVLDRQSASPADGDRIGTISFNGKNDAAEAHGYAKIEARIVDASNATEDGRLELMTSVATEEGVSRILMTNIETSINDNSRDLDFRVESNNQSEMLIVNAGTDLVGIKGNPAGANGVLQVTGSIGLTGSAEIRQSTNADDGSTLRFLGTQLVIANSNSNGYSYSGGGLVASVSPLAGAITLDVGANSTSGHRLNLTNGGDGVQGSLNYKSGSNSRFSIDSSSGTIVAGNSTQATTIVRLDHENSGGKAELQLNSHGSASFSMLSNFTGSTVNGVATGNFGLVTPHNASIVINTSGLERIKAESAGNVVINEGGVDSDFRVESSGNANMLFVDGGANKVGIGTNSLGRVFNVYHPTTDGAIKLETGGNASNVWAGIEFKTPTSQGFIYVPSNDSTGLMKFLPASSEVLALSNSAVVVNEQSNDVDFRIESDVNAQAVFVNGENSRVGLGTIGPESQLHLRETADTANKMVIDHVSAGNSWGGYIESIGGANQGLVIGRKFNASYTPVISMNVSGQSTFAGNLVVPNQIIHEGDTSNYMQFHQADGWRIVNSGGERFHIQGNQAVFNHDGHDADFRVESDSNDHMLFVDGGNNVVNIGHATNTVGTSSGTLMVNFIGNVANGIKIRDTRGEAGTNNMMIFVRGDNEVGTITSTTSATAYNTSSDQRLKENIADADDAGSKIDAIQVRKFDWKVDGSHQDYGMVAQELQAVAPEAVSAPENPEDMMAVDYSKLVPMLVKEIQTLRARVADLES